jgi:hypothetical protein
MSMACRAAFAAARPLLLKTKRQIVVPRDWTYGYFGLAQIATLMRSPFGAILCRLNARAGR